MSRFQFKEADFYEAVCIGPLNELLKRVTEQANELVREKVWKEQIEEGLLAADSVNQNGNCGISSPHRREQSRP